MKLDIPYTTTDFVPTKANDGDAGFDLMATEDVVLFPDEPRVVPTGLRIALPLGSAGLVLPRSGLAKKHDVTVANAPGLIDSGYRGEVGVLLVNRANTNYHVKRGDRVAQLVIVSLPIAHFALVASLEASERGEGGFGSSGR